jgi:hypothetical protein
MGQMKPQFDKVIILSEDKDKQVICVSGPVDLEGTEKDVYLWVMLHQDAAARGDSENVFGQGTGALEADQVEALVAAEKRSAAAKPRWSSKFEVKAKFKAGCECRAEAVAIVRAERGMNRIVWWDDVVKEVTELQPGEENPCPDDDDPSAEAA